MAFARERAARAVDNLPWNRPEAPKGPGSSPSSSLITQPQKRLSTTPAQPAALVHRKPPPPPPWNGAYTPTRSLPTGASPMPPTGPSAKRNFLGGS